VPDAADPYFTWDDGRLGYRCAGCGACCRGHGIGLDVAGGQLEALTARHPALVRSCGGAATR
jgi:hypothetical protein